MEIGDFSCGREVSSPQAISRLETLVGSIHSFTQRPAHTKIFFTPVPIIHHETRPGCYDVHRNSLLNIVVVSGDSAEVFVVRVVQRQLGGFAVEEKSLFTFHVLYPPGLGFNHKDGWEQVVRDSLQKFIG